MSEVSLIVRGGVTRCSVERQDGAFIVRAGGVTSRLRLSRLEQGVYRLESAGQAEIVRVARAGARTFLYMDGYTLEYATSGDVGHGSASRTSAGDDLTAPMPGAVTQVLVREGDEVVRGQPLVIVEAMKMEHVIRAPRAGSVRAVRARPGDQVDTGAVLVEIAGPPDERPR
jgi:biotin carboxyl carrier protein